MIHVSNGVSFLSLCVSFNSKNRLIFWTTLLALGVAQGLLLAVVLQTFKSANRLGNQLLAVMLFLFSLLLLEEYLESSGLYRYYPKVLLSTFTFDALFGPLIYLYVQSVCQRVNARLILYHLLPIVLLSALFCAFHFLTPRGAFVWVDPEMTTTFIILVNLKIVYLIVYFTFALKRLRKMQLAPVQQLPINNRIQIKALRVILLVILTLTLCIYFIFDWNVIFPGSLPSSDNFTVVLITLTIYAIVYIAIRFPFVFTEVRPLEYYKEKIQTANEQQSYKTSSLTSIQKEEITKQLLELMVLSKPHRNQQLKIEDIAEQLKIPTHHLSQVINEVLDKNFYEFINFYRVEEVKQRMEDPTQRYKSLMGIAQDAGFNSKSTFNRVFKEFTGVSPSAFLARKDSSQ